MKTKALAVIAAAMMIAAACAMLSDGSDASPGTASGRLVMHAGGADREVSAFFSSSENSYCYVAGSDEDKQMQEFLLYDTVSFPTPLASEDEDAEKYAIYRFTDQGGNAAETMSRVFTVAEDGDVEVSIHSSHQFALNGEMDTEFEGTKEAKAGDMVVLSCPESASSPSSYWFTVDYSITNVEMPEGTGFANKYLTYGAFGAAAAVLLIMMYLSHRPKLYSGPIEKLKRRGPALKILAVIAVCGLVVGGYVYVQGLTPGDAELDSAEIEEGLTIETSSETVVEYEGSTLKDRSWTVYTVTSVEDDWVSYTESVYTDGSSVPTTSAHVTSKDDFKNDVMGFMDSSADIARALSTYGKVSTGSETVDTKFGSVSCNVYRASSQSIDMAYYLHNGQAVKYELTIKETSYTETITYCLTSIGNE